MNPEIIRSMTVERPTDTAIVATRVIDAPLELVWAAHTECEHIRKWLLGPEDWTMPECTFEPHAGGAWRYVFEGPGEGFSMGGENLEVEAPRRLVQTEMLNGEPPSTINTLTLRADGDRTVIETRVEYPSAEIREEIINTGMLAGWAESYERLEAYLRSLR